MRANSIGGALVAIALLSKGAFAGPRHGHHHKRVLVVETDLDVVYQTVTDVVWVTVTGSDGAVTTTTAPAVQPATTTTSVAVTSTPVAAVSTPAAPVVSTTSSVVVVASTSTSVSVPAPAPVQSTSSVAPVASPTTLSTVVASSPAYVSSAAAYVQQQATSAVASSTSSAAATSSGTSSGSKRGLSYNEASFLDLFTGSSTINWCYNWGSTEGGTVPDGFEYVPMLWDLSSSATGDWATNAQSAIDNGATALLSFNEPDNLQQANLTPSAAAAGHIQYMNPFSGKAKIGAPAVTNGGSPGGLTWLSDFIDACNGECDFDFVPIHWYDSATNYEYFKQHVQQAYVAGGNRTLWITEFGATGSTDEQVTFLETVMPWLDEQDYVERYAYFMDEVGVLLESVSELSSLGKTFMDYTSSTISSLIADV